MLGRVSLVIFVVKRVIIHVIVQFYRKYGKTKGRRDIKVGATRMEGATPRDRELRRETNKATGKPSCGPDEWNDGL